MTQPLNYLALAAFIDQQRLWFEPAEFHGLLTAAVLLKKDKEINELAFSPNHQPSAITQQLMRAMAEHIRGELEEGQMIYRLALAEEPLSTRAESLVQWLQGFLYVFDRVKPPLGEEQKEFLDQLRAFAQLDTNLAEGRDNELMLNQLEEHCRLGVFLFVYQT